jgi:uncharacterized protein (DUF302 family)
MTSDNGLITIPSAHSAKDTIDRIESEVKSKGMTVFARIDHAAGANEVGLKLAPSEILIFGSANGRQRRATTVLPFGLAVGRTHGSHGLPCGALHEVAGGGKGVVRRLDLELP